LVYYHTMGSDWEQVGERGAGVRGFKIGVTKWMRTNTDVHEVWQRNYYEHKPAPWREFRMMCDACKNPKCRKCLPI